MAIGFFSLPLELREMVYECVVPKEPGKNLSGPPRGVGVLTLLQLNRQIYFEARHVLLKKAGPIVIKLYDNRPMIKMGTVMSFPQQWNSFITKNAWFHELPAIRIEVEARRYLHTNPAGFLPWYVEDPRERHASLIGNLLVVIEGIKTRTQPPAIELVLSGPLHSNVTPENVVSFLGVLLRPMRELRGIPRGGINISIEAEKLVSGEEGWSLCIWNTSPSGGLGSFSQYAQPQNLCCGAHGNVLFAPIRGEVEQHASFHALATAVRLETVGLAPHTPMQLSLAKVYRLHVEYGRLRAREPTADIYADNGLRRVTDQATAFFELRAAAVKDLFG